MTPREEAAYLRHLAGDVDDNEHLGHIARLIIAAFLRGRAACLERGDTPHRRVDPC